MTHSRHTRSTWTTEALARACDILRRVKQLDTYGCWDFENTRNREQAVLQLSIDLLQGPYLTLTGLRRVKEMLGWSEDWIDEAEATAAEED
jgi:hypothetical protein